MVLQIKFLVFYIGVLYDDIYSLLISHIFTDLLCLHKFISNLEDKFNILNLSDDDLERYKFFNSNLSQKHFYLKYIFSCLSYIKFLQSAFFHYLMFKIEKNELSHFIQMFPRILNVNNKYSSILYRDLVKLKLFETFPCQCLDGFFHYFTDFEIISFFVFTNPDDLFLMEKKHRIFQLINAFSFYFSSKFRSQCFEYCVNSKSFLPLFLALKIYQIKLLHPELSLNELYKIKLLKNFTECCLRHDSIPKKNLNKLIKLNWHYNYG